MKDTRKLLFMGLLCTLLIFSNIVGLKIILLFKLPVSCSVFMYPITFLIVAAITELYGYKTAFKSVLVAFLCQLVCFGLSTLICNLPMGATSLTIDQALQTLLANEVTGSIYHPAFSLIIGTSVAFVVSQTINICLYSYFHKHIFSWLAAALSMLIALVIDAIIFIAISKVGVIPGGTVAEAFMNQFIIRVALTLVLTIVFPFITAKKDN